MRALNRRSVARTTLSDAGQAFELTENPGVDGSIPSLATISARFYSGHMGNCRVPLPRWHTSSFERGLPPKVPARTMVIVVVLPLTQLLVEQVNVVRDAVTIEHAIRRDDRVRSIAIRG